MSEPTPATAESSPLPFVIVRIVTDHVHAIKALAATAADCLDHAMLRSSYENTINLAWVLYSSENLTDWFDTLVTENEDLALERDATIADRNALTTWVTQLMAQLTQTLALMSAATNVLPASCKGQTDPEKFTREDGGKLRSFVALCHLHLIDRPREFPNE
jgi:hypothetical protein